MNFMRNWRAILMPLCWNFRCLTLLSHMYFYRIYWVINILIIRISEAHSYKRENYFKFSKSFTRDLCFVPYYKMEVSSDDDDAVNLLIDFCRIRLYYSFLCMHKHNSSTVKSDFYLFEKVLVCGWSVYNIIRI